MERRAFRRLPAEAEVTIQVAPARGSSRAAGKNISGNGILFEAQVRYEPGQTLDIEVLTPTHRAFTHVFRPLRARVRVVRATGERAPYRIAAVFLKVERGI
jgi:hypothetical protein